MLGNFKVICLLFINFETDIVLLEDQFVPNKLKQYNVWNFKGKIVEKIN